MKSKRKRRLRVGCMADDFTGAGDAASFLAKGGMKTLLLIWPCEEEICLAEYDAVVIALKSRSEPKENAIEESIAALRWLRQKGAEQLYFKYCSTFDSTREGNIGPVCDALLEELNTPYTILCPSLLANARSVENGILYVDHIPLAQSHMRNHPLNPMWDSSIERLMDCQSRYPSFIVRANEFEEPDKLKERIEALKKTYSHFYLIPDYCVSEHGKEIAAFFRELSVMTGGSGLLVELAHAAGFSGSGIDTEIVAGKAHRGRLMIAGSCSSMTQKQVSEWLNRGGKAVRIGIEEIQKDGDNAAELAEIYLQNQNEDILYFSAGSVGQKETGENFEISVALEQFMAEIARNVLSAAKVDRLIVAGGETSGAVVKMLGWNAFRIGRSVAPGVPVLHPIEDEQKSVVLKSGNFGDQSFFLHTLNESSV